MLRHITFTIFITTSINTLTTKIIPKTSILLINKKHNKTNINIKNTNNHPSLLYTTIINLPKNNKSIHLIPTQPIIHIKTNQIQQIQFLLQTTIPLQSKKLKHITFKNIPPKNNKNNKITISIHQNLPILIHPTSLPKKQKT